MGTAKKWLWSHKGKELTYKSRVFDEIVWHLHAEGADHKKLRPWKGWQKTLRFLRKEWLSGILMVTITRQAATLLCHRQCHNSIPAIHVSLTQPLMHCSQLVSSWNIILKCQDVIVANKWCCLFPTHHHHLKENSASLGLRAPRGVSPWPKLLPHLQYCQRGANGPKVNEQEHYLCAIARLLQHGCYTHTPFSQDAHIHHSDWIGMNSSVSCLAIPKTCLFSSSVFVFQFSLLHGMHTSFYS